MRIGASLVGQKDQKNSQLLSVIKTKKNRKRNKKSTPSVVQNLYHTCKQVFATCEAATAVPPPGDLERLRVVLGNPIWMSFFGGLDWMADAKKDSMKPSDVGLTPDLPYFRTIETEGTPPVTYLHLYECNQFSMGIFCLPPSGVIPLHNHPGMTVFSKLLFGSMHIKSYDWADLPHGNGENINPAYGQPPGVRLSKVKVDSNFTAPCNTSILYPNVGNMHCFTALTSCAVLDVLGPPYSDPEGRHCTYYRDLPCNSFPGVMGFVSEDEREGYVWLEEKEKPDDFNVVGALYRGPKVVK